MSFFQEDSPSLGPKLQQNYPSAVAEILSPVLTPFCCCQCIITDQSWCKRPATASACKAWCRKCVCPGEDWQVVLGIQACLWPGCHEGWSDLPRSCFGPQFPDSARAASGCTPALWEPAFPGVQGIALTSRTPSRGAGCYLVGFCSAPAQQGRTRLLGTVAWTRLLGFCSAPVLRGGRAGCGLPRFPYVASPFPLARARGQSEHLSGTLDCEGRRYKNGDMG